jgi:hypothetical protein
MCRQCTKGRRGGWHLLDVILSNLQATPGPSYIFGTGTLLVNTVPIVMVVVRKLRR